MGFVEIDPGYAELCRRHGLESARALLEVRGRLVGGHADRHVAEVVIGGTRFFLKCEERVPWRERLKSAWEGHGWVSQSVREARLLRQARAAGIDCPEVAAVGEDGPRAFVVLRAVEGLTDLRSFLAQPRPDADRRALAVRLGRALAELHRAGFDHPDLYAKHVLVGREPCCFLDWQRSRRRHRVGWRRRCRDLAALDASLVEALAGPRLRVRCLRAYLAATLGAPPLARVAAAVRGFSARLLRRRKVRRLRERPVAP